jgi:hypothetical protein
MAGSWRCAVDTRMRTGQALSYFIIVITDICANRTGRDTRHLVPEIGVKAFDARILGAFLARTAKYVWARNAF